MLREIRGVDQKTPGLVKRWFQDEYFDLVAWHDPRGTILRFQLCYARESFGERVLEWQRSLGFQHLRATDEWGSRIGAGSTWALSLVREPLARTGELKRRFLAAAAEVPELLREFIEDKLDELARPRRYRPANARTPLWLERLHARKRAELRERLLATADPEITP